MKTKKQIDEMMKNEFDNFKNKMKHIELSSIAIQKIDTIIELLNDKMIIDDMNYTKNDDDDNMNINVEMIVENLTYERKQINDEMYDNQYNIEKFVYCVVFENDDNIETLHEFLIDAIRHIKHEFVEKHYFEKNYTFNDVENACDEIKTMHVDYQCHDKQNRIIDVTITYDDIDCVDKIRIVKSSLN